MYTAVQDYLALEEGYALWLWSDDYVYEQGPTMPGRSRTQEEIVAVLRGAAVVEAARESQLAEVSS